MYLFGLNSLLTPLVSINRPQTLTAAMERARDVETGYNFKTPLGNSNTTEVDELTRKIEQLSLNYATLTSALAVQPVNDNLRRNNSNNTNSSRFPNRPPRTQFNRSPRQNEDRVCYNCNQPG